MSGRGRVLKFIREQGVKVKKKMIKKVVHQDILLSFREKKTTIHGLREKKPTAQL